MLDASQPNMRPGGTHLPIRDLDISLAYPYSVHLQPCPRLTQPFGVGVGVGVGFDPHLVTSHNGAMCKSAHKIIKEFIVFYLCLYSVHPYLTQRQRALMHLILLRIRSTQQSHPSGDSCTQYTVIYRSLYLDSYTASRTGSTLATQ